MSQQLIETNLSASQYCQGIWYLGESLAGQDSDKTKAAIAPGEKAIASPQDPAAVYQTMLAADALRYLTLQMTATKGSGHPGGFTSAAEVHAALFMLGQKNILTDLGHHAPGFYSALFLDGSLEAMGIETVEQLCDRFREYKGLPGHVSGKIPGLLAPAGALGQGQHFAMAAAKLHPGSVFPFTVGDAGLAEPYIINSINLFHTAYPLVTNFLPVLVWNGYGQEYQSIFSAKSDEEMMAYWRGNGFDEAILIDAKDFDDALQDGKYVDSTKFSLEQRLKFTQAILEGLERAIALAKSGKLTVFIIKQIKGAGIHADGVASHKMSATQKLNAALWEEKDFTPEQLAVFNALCARALSPEVWELVRTNFQRSSGGPAAKTVVTESEFFLPPLEELPLQEYPIGGGKKAPSTAIGDLIAYLGRKDPYFTIANADGNSASGIANVNAALKVVHPLSDRRYHQEPFGQVFEPINEDACAGLTAALSLLGARSLWCSFEAFAINGLPVWQTVTQAMAELRYAKPSAIALFSACGLEQARNGITHERPEVESYLAAMMHNGNVFSLFPVDANSSQVCYDWAVTTKNKGIAIFASKSALPIRTTLAQTRQALRDGAVVLQEIPGEKTVVFAAIGDLILNPVYEAAQQLQERGIGSKIVSAINPRRLYRRHDLAWESCFEPDGIFLDDGGFDRLFAGDALIGVTGGASGMLEPIMMRSNLKRDLFCWKRGDTAASPEQLMASNGLTASAFVRRAIELLV